MLIITRKKDYYTHRFFFEIAERETILIQVKISLFSKWRVLLSPYTNTKTYFALCYEWLFLKWIKTKKMKGTL